MRLRLLMPALFMLLLSQQLFAQFQGQLRQVGPPGSQQQEGTKANDTTYQGTQREPYPIKRYFKSLAGKDSMNITRMWGGSLLLPGSAQ